MNTILYNIWGKYRIFLKVSSIVLTIYFFYNIGTIALYLDAIVLHQHEDRSWLISPTLFLAFFICMTPIFLMFFIKDGWVEHHTSLQEKIEKEEAIKEEEMYKKKCASNLYLPSLCDKIKNTPIRPCVLVQGKTLEGMSRIASRNLKTESLKENNHV